MSAEQTNAHTPGITDADELRLIHALIEAFPEDAQRTPHESTIDAVIRRLREVPAHRDEYLSLNTQLVALAAWLHNHNLGVSKYVPLRPAGLPVATTVLRLLDGRADVVRQLDRLADHLIRNHPEHADVTEPPGGLDWAVNTAIALLDDLAGARQMHAEYRNRLQIAERERPLSAARNLVIAARALVQACGRVRDWWAEGDATVHEQLWRDLHSRSDELTDVLNRIEQRLRPASLELEQPSPEPPAEPDPAGQPNPALDRQMANIAATYPAVEYDAHDRPEEVAAVLAAAAVHGLVAIPSGLITPRTIRGTALPGPAAGPGTMYPAAIAAINAAALDTGGGEYHTLVEQALTRLQEQLRDGAGAILADLLAQGNIDAQHSEQTP